MAVTQLNGSPRSTRKQITRQQVQSEKHLVDTGRWSLRTLVIPDVGHSGRRISKALDFGAWVIKAPDSALLLSNKLQTIFINRDRITTCSPGNGGGVVRRYNGRRQSPDRDPGVTPVQRQGYPSIRPRRRMTKRRVLNTIEQLGDQRPGQRGTTVRADFVHFGDTASTTGDQYCVRKSSCQHSGSSDTELSSTL